MGSTMNIVSKGNCRVLVVERDLSSHAEFWVRKSWSRERDSWALVLKGSNIPRLIEVIMSAPDSEDEIHRRFPTSAGKIVVSRISEWDHGKELAILVTGSQSAISWNSVHGLDMVTVDLVSVMMGVEAYLHAHKWEVSLIYGEDELRRELKEYEEKFSR